MRPAQGLAAALVWLAAGVATATPTPWRGAGGGPERRASCPAQSVLVGLSGYLMERQLAVDAILCSRVFADGKWAGGVAAVALPGAAARGAAFRLQCPAHHALAGLAGRAAATVETQALRCAPLAQSDDGRIVAGVAMDGPGTGAGAPAFADTCPSGALATALDVAAADGTVGRLRLDCGAQETFVKYGVESLVLSRDTLRPGESATLTITLAGPAGPGHRIVVHQPPYGVPADFTASPGWTVTVPPRQRSLTLTISANPTARPAFGGPYVDLHPDYDPAAPTRRLTVVGR